MPTTSTTLTELAANALARLQTTLPATVDVLDGPPGEGENPGPVPRTDLYAYLVDDPGVLLRERYTRQNGARTWHLAVVCCGLDRDGARHVEQLVTDSLDGWRPDTHPGTSQLVHDTTGPVLPDGPPGDVRYSRTVVYSATVGRMPLA